MKYPYSIFCLIVLLFGVNTSCMNAQMDFAPVGAKWYYDYTGFAFNGYFSLESDRDTTILGKACKVIKQRSESYSFIDQRLYARDHDDRIICFENNIVYHYFDNDFHIICDFNAVVNDEWIFKSPDAYTDCDSTTITVDSIYQKEVNGLEFKTFVTSHSENANVGFYYYSPVEILERIGPEYYLFGADISLPSSECEPELIDEVDIGKIRCYSDNEIGMVKFGETDCDYVRVDSSIDELINADLKRPFYNNGIVYFNDVKLNTEILICDILGNVIYQGFIPETKQINLSQYPSGLYVVKVLGMKNWALKVFVE